jgi:hypothetical protein
MKSPDLQAANCRESAPGRRGFVHGWPQILPILSRDTKEKERNMTACPRCDARFTGAPDIERQWIERHIGRHGATRLAIVNDAPAREPRKLNTAA